MNQLVRVNDPNDPTGGENGTTWLYTYDRGGNMKERIAYQYSTAEQPPNFIQMWINHYDPDWKDKLLDSNGITVDYDANGNPTEYWGWEYTWEKGRQLKKAHYIYYDPVTLEFKYNKSGLRTQKVKKVRDVITETTDYVMSNKTLISMKKGNDTLYFSYDMSSGSPVMVTYNGARYTYVKNLLGDIVALADASGSIVCEYKYDAWGKPLSVTGTMAQTIGALNPFRYRGYIWDEDMENYYLRSRYYNPSLCRFLQADSHLTINAFAYANNNPVMKIDADGTEANKNETTSVVLYLHCSDENPNGQHYSLSIGDLWFSYGPKQKDDCWANYDIRFLVDEIKNAESEKLRSDLDSTTKIRIINVPFEYAKKGIKKMISFLIDEFSEIESARSMEEIYSATADKAKLHHISDPTWAYSYWTNPCIAPLIEGLKEMDIKLEKEFGSFYWTEEETGSGESFYLRAFEYVKERIKHNFTEVVYPWSRVN